MAQSITLWGATYSNVPAVDLPKAGGGTARFNDTTDADATVSDILEGKTAYVNGVKITGTIVDGNSLEYGLTDATSSRVGVGKVGSMIIE